MQIEIIEYKGAKVKKKTKQNGMISYAQKGVYLGVDVKTGKQVTTTITGRTLKELDRKSNRAKLEFEKNGFTKKERIEVHNLEDLAEAWYKSYKTLVSSENTLNRVRGYLDNYIIPKFGDFQLQQIDASDVQLWVTEMANNAREAIDKGKLNKKGNAQDVGAMAHKLSDIFDFGITHCNLEKNPVSSIKIPPKPKRNKECVMVLHDEDLAKWLIYLTTLPNTRGNRRFKIICETLLCSALRINELLALKISDLDMEHSEISVNKTLMWKNPDKKLGIKGKVICKPTPKSEAGFRNVSVPLEVLERLKEFHKEMNGYFESHDLPKSELIFPTIYGAFMCDRNERTTLKKRLIEVGLPDYGFHLFRHTHASMLLNAGANWKELQVRMGHKSISTTMDAYAELAPKRKVEAVNIYNAKMEELKQLC